MRGELFNLRAWRSAFFDLVESEQPLEVKQKPYIPFEEIETYYPSTPHERTDTRQENKD